MFSKINVGLVFTFSPYWLFLFSSFASHNKKKNEIQNIQKTEGEIDKN